MITRFSKMVHKCTVHKKTGNFLHTSISSLLNLKIGLLGMECFTAACLETADTDVEHLMDTHTRTRTRACV